MGTNCNSSKFLCEFLIKLISPWLHGAPGSRKHPTATTTTTTSVMIASSHPPAQTVPTHEIIEKKHTHTTTDHNNFL